MKIAESRLPPCNKRPFLGTAGKTRPIDKRLANLRDFARAMAKNAAASTLTFLMRYLVTGAAGYIGSSLVDRLLGPGHHVVVLVSLSTAIRPCPLHHTQYSLVGKYMCNYLAL